MKYRSVMRSKGEVLLGDDKRRKRRGDRRDMRDDGCQGEEDPLRRVRKESKGVKERERCHRDHWARQEVGKGRGRKGRGTWISGVCFRWR